MYYLKPSFNPNPDPKLSFLPNILTLEPKIWYTYTGSILWYLLSEDVESFFLDKHCFYNKLYLQRVTRGGK